MSRTTEHPLGQGQGTVRLSPGHDDPPDPGSATRRVGSAALITPPSSGLPIPVAVGVALAMGFTGAALDVWTGGGLHLIFGIAFVTGCVLAAVLVRRRGLAAAVVLPPLAYVAVAVAAGLMQRDTGTSWLTQAGFELVNALISGAPILLIATAATAAVSLVRLVLGASGDRLRR